MDPGQDLSRKIEQVLYDAGIPFTDGMVDYFHRDIETAVDAALGLEGGEIRITRAASSTNVQNGYELTFEIDNADGTTVDSGTLTYPQSMVDRTVIDDETRELAGYLEDYGSEMQLTANEAKADGLDPDQAAYFRWYHDRGSALIRIAEELRRRCSTCNCDRSSDGSCPCSFRD